MNFQLSEDQQALAETIASLCQGRFPLERIREAEGKSEVMTAQDWSVLGEAGVFSIVLPIDQGGVGLGMADACVIFEELGKALVPGPLVPSLLAAGVVPGAAEGTSQVGVIERPVIGAHARTPILMQHAAGAQAFIILDTTWSTGSAPLLVDAAAVAELARPIERPLDPLSPVWAITSGDLESVVTDAREILPVSLFKDRPSASQLDADLWAHGAIVTAALQVGIAGRCVEMAVAYGGERHQFGRPIGSFQAIKHLCADMLVRSEVARSALHAAAVLIDDRDARADVAEGAGVTNEAMARRAIAGAKALADEAALTNPRGCIQVHGGMGFTWEMPLHLYLKRARVHATTFGMADDMEREVAALW